MAKMIQIRNVPEALHRKLKSRAAHQGKSLSAYLLEQIKREAEAPTIEELIERLASRSPINLGKPVTDIIREEREERADYLDRRR